MAIQISGTTVIDNGRNILGVGITATTKCDLPDGNIASRPTSPAVGSVRYNTDLGLFEFYTGTAWNQIGSSVFSTNRGLFAGGNFFTPPSTTNFSSTIDYIDISSTGNAIGFGNLTSQRTTSACSSTTRGVFGELNLANSLNVLDYVTIASVGDASTFGSLTVGRNSSAGHSSPTRGVFGGGYSPVASNVIDYITIASTGNATDFGDLTSIRRNLSSCSSPTRGIFGGGYVPGSIPSRVNIIDYITIASTGNAIDFGDLLAGNHLLAAFSSSTRGVFGGGSAPGPTSSIQYITIASTGNAISFGNLTEGRESLGGCSNSTRGAFGGGFVGPSPSTSRSNTIDYITIASTGNAIDFGDLTTARAGLSGCSSGHGGLT